MWGIIPAAGNGTRIQPLAFSKELLPVGSRRDESGAERPRAVSEYLIERMARAGVDKICVVISPSKSDILQYYGGSIGDISIAYVIQNRPAGLCDAIFRALPLIHPDETVIIGLPDTIWFPADALAALADDAFSFLLFPVDHPELFDAVQTNADDRVLRIEVKSATAPTGWIWGAIKLPGHRLHELATLWHRRDCRDEFIGTLVNAWLAEGGVAHGVRAGERYVDVGTLDGYRQAARLLGEFAPMQASEEPLPIGPRSEPA
jgi:glucose-1-phosphate thymidylyltransferase